MTEHQVFFEQEQKLLDIANSPGFPHVRIHPALRESARMNEISSADETLLLAVHLQANQLLVITNKSAIIYLIPKLPTKLQVAGSIGLKVGIGMIPIVGDLLDAGEKLLKPVEWVKASKERKQDKLLSGEGMPTNEDINTMAWDFRNPGTLQLLLIYKEKILIKNGFRWKEMFKVSFEKATEQTLVTVEERGIRIKSGRKEAMALYLDNSWEPLKIAALLVEDNRQALEAMGCTIEKAEQKFIFTRC